jgi:hypothetical protein
MAKILTFKCLKASERHKGKGLCREGFHKWVVEKQSVFDVKKGRLVTGYRYRRCGKFHTTGE